MGGDHEGGGVHEGAVRGAVRGRGAGRAAHGSRAYEATTMAELGWCHRSIAQGDGREPGSPAPRKSSGARGKCARRLPRPWIRRCPLHIHWKRNNINLFFPGDFVSFAFWRRRARGTALGGRTRPVTGRTRQSTSTNGNVPRSGSHHTRFSLVLVGETQDTGGVSLCAQRERCQRTRPTSNPNRSSRGQQMTPAQTPIHITRRCTDHGRERRIHSTTPGTGFPVPRKPTPSHLLNGS